MFADVIIDIQNEKLDRIFQYRIPQEIEDRLDLLRNLKRKYGPTVAEVLAFGEKARAELETIEFSDQRLEELSARRNGVKAKAEELAAQLSRARQKAFEQFSGQIAESLRFLNMPGIRFTLQHRRRKRRHLVQMDGLRWSS